MSHRIYRKKTDWLRMSTRLGITSVSKKEHAGAWLESFLVKRDKIPCVLFHYHSLPCAASEWIRAEMDIASSFGPQNKPIDAYMNGADTEAWLLYPYVQPIRPSAEQLGRDLASLQSRLSRIELPLRCARPDYTAGSLFDRLNKQNFSPELMRISKEATQKAEQIWEKTVFSKLTIILAANDIYSFSLKEAGSFIFSGIGNPEIDVSSILLPMEDPGDIGGFLTEYQRAGNIRLSVTGIALGAFFCMLEWSLRRPDVHFMDFVDRFALPVLSNHLPQAEFLRHSSSYLEIGY